MMQKYNDGDVHSVLVEYAAVNHKSPDPQDRYTAKPALNVTIFVFTRLDIACVFVCIFDRISTAIDQSGPGDRTGADCGAANRQTAHP